MFSQLLGSHTNEEQTPGGGAFVLHQASQGGVRTVPTHPAQWPDLVPSSLPGRLLCEHRGLKNRAAQWADHTVSPTWAVGGLESHGSAADGPPVGCDAPAVARVAVTLDLREGGQRGRAPRLPWPRTTEGL